MTNQNPQFINSYFSDLLFYHSFSKYVWDYDAADLQAFQMFRNSDLFAPSISTMTPDGSFNTPIKNVQNVQGIVTTSNQNADGISLDVTFTDSTLATFRIGQKVRDANMYEGQVISMSPGFITIHPLNNPTILTAGSYFKINTLIQAVGKIAATFNSVGTTSIYDQKDVQTDWCEITRESIQIARHEKPELFQGNAPSGEDVFYSFFQNEADTFNRFLFQCVWKYMFGKGGTGIQLPDGVGSKTYGIRNRIIDGSGNYVSGGAPIDQVTFEQQLFQCATVNPNFGQDIHIFPGIRAARQLSTFYPSATAFAAATKNAEKKIDIGLQTASVNLAGLDVKIVLNFGLLNSQKVPDWMKDSVYMLNMAPITMQGKQGKLVQLIHSNVESGSTNGMLRRETPGMTGSGSTNSSGLGNIGQNQVTTSPVDGTTIEFLDDSGVAMIPKGHGLFEYIH